MKPTTSTILDDRIFFADCRSIRKLRALLYLALIIFLMSNALVARSEDTATTAKLGQALAEKVAVSDPSERITALVWPNSSVSDSPQEKFTSEELSRHERYLLVRQRLEDQSRIAQKELIVQLDSLIASGIPLQYRRHWLINLVSVEMPVYALESLGRLPSVSRLSSIPQLESIVPLVSDQKALLRSSQTSLVQSNITSIGAPDVWEAGFTGRGRIICSFDTGVDGDHPALRDSWQGTDGNSQAAWFDPVERHATPSIISSSALKGHGTHTMGIMVGRDKATGDTIGVAPGAHWISAAVIDIPGASIVDAFEWAADPDGDPNTIADVPDVINHSWGVPNSVMGCDALFWSLIDNTEALGIVNIFSAGNEGRQGEMTIRNPANRARGPLDCLAVGNVNHRDAGSPGIASSSSRGPSDCDGISVKPNVVAPGMNIRSAAPGATYVFKSGASMSAPHVSGIVALLREKNPNATVVQIKQALLAGAEDLGALGPDNSYGWGYINALTSLQALTSSPGSQLRLYSFSPNQPDGAGIVRGRVTLLNTSFDGSAATGVTGRLNEGAPAIEIISGSLTFGRIGPGEKILSREELVIKVSDSLAEGSVLPLDFTVFANGGFFRRETVFVLIGERVEKQFYTHNTGKLKFTVSNFGEYGFANGSYTPLGFAGFVFDGEENSSLFEMAFMLGVDSLHVSDGVRNIGLEPDRDFSPAPGGALQVGIPGALADVETSSSFSDSLALNPLGLVVRQQSFSWTDSAYNSMVVLDYTIVNQSAFSVGGVYAGLFADWDIGIYAQNSVSFLPRDDLGFVVYDGDERSEYRAIAALSHSGLAGHYAQNMSEMGSLRNPFTETYKYSAVSSGFSQATSLGQGDMAHFASIGPYNISPSDSVRATFALIAGYSIDELRSAASAARLLMDSLLNSLPGGGPVRPTGFHLSQNFPNPFNPSTRIEYSISSPGAVRLEVFNILGQLVKTLVDSDKPAGNHVSLWSGVDESGNSVASGVYLYSLTSPQGKIARKMALVR